LYILTQQPEQTLQPLSGTFWDFVPEHYPQQSVVGGEELLTNGLAPTTIMHGPTCLPDKCFRFARTPRQLAERFTGLVPLRQALTNQPNSSTWLFFTMSFDANFPAGEYHDHLENPGNGAFVSEKAFIPSSGANPYACQPYFSNPHNQILRPVAEEQVSRSVSKIKLSEC
jgi:hypothetical protein